MVSNLSDDEKEYCGSTGFRIDWVVDACNRAEKMAKDKTPLFDGTTVIGSVNKSSTNKQDWEIILDPPLRGKRFKFYTFWGSNKDDIKALNKMVSGTSIKKLGGSFSQSKLWDSILPGVITNDGREPRLNLPYLRITGIVPGNLEFRIRRLIEGKKQVILSGPPGTSKTYTAMEFIRRNWIKGGKSEVLGKRLVQTTKEMESRQLCILLRDHPNKKNPDLVEGTKVPKGEIVWDIVQFHPAYSYEDFVSGIESKSNLKGGVSFERVRKIFSKMVLNAKENEGTDFVLIIDEINRGILGRIFGELIMSLEYRNTSISSPGGIIKIPENLYLIGTMNTADRNIAMVDHALRRRFRFIPALPDSQILDDHLEKKRVCDGMSESDANLIRCNFDALQNIFKDGEEWKEINGLLGSDYAVGHTYFLVDSIEELMMNLRFQVHPLLDEYVKEGALTKADIQPYARSLKRLIRMR